MTKDNKTYIGIIVIFAIIILFGLYFKFSVLSDCSLNRVGSLTRSYDSNTDVYTVFGYLSLGRIASDAGCVGFTEITNCVPIENRTIKSTGYCRIYDDWTGTLILKSEWIINDDLPFDGCSVFFPYAGSWKQRECNFEINVLPPPPPEPVCLTNADINCDGIISRTELGVSITKFLTGTISRSELGEIIQAWAI